MCEQLLASIYDPAGSNQQTQNPFARRLELIVDPRLDATSATAWYLVCNPTAFAWIKRIYLQDQMQPYIEEKAGWEIDALEIKCRHDFAANAYMWQGAIYNAGA